MHVLCVVGARPNFVKIAPILRAMRRLGGIESVLVHTGQHYDALMSEQFLIDLEIPQPDFNLGVGSGSHAWQTAEVMKRLEPVFESARPDVVVVVGDVNSTLAAALTAAKLDVRVAHVEAGLRSFDRRMPEEINRVLTDGIADLLFVSEPSGQQNLRREGIPSERIYFVGNVMIDALFFSRPRWERSSVRNGLGLGSDTPYIVVTLHRPSNVDDSDRLRAFMGAFDELAGDMRVIFPTHPRVQNGLKRLGLHGSSNLTLVDPLGYLDFVALVSRATLVLTDSGGLQKESTALRVPCLTVRDNTERPVTVTHGTNRVIGGDPGRIVHEARLALACPVVPEARPPRWDGKASDRIARVLKEAFGSDRPAPVLGKRKRALDRPGAGTAVTVPGSA